MYRSFIDIRDSYRRIYTVTPNELGSRRLNSWYKFFTRPLKSLPFLYIIPVSAVLTIFLYLLFGKQLITKLVSMLQYGF